MAMQEVPEGDVVLPRADVEELQRMVARYDELLDRDDTAPADLSSRAAALVGYLGAALAHARAGGR